MRTTLDRRLCSTASNVWFVELCEGKLFWARLTPREVYANVAMIFVSIALCGVATWDSIAQAYEMSAPPAGDGAAGDAAAALHAD